MKCVAGFSTEDVSLIARAVLGNYESPLITQPTGFQEHASFYTSLEKCYNGAKNVTVNCPSTFQAAFYSQSKNNITYSAQ